MKEALKHRLIGAAVIAAVAVLFLPSFFKDRQAYDVDTSSHIPSRPSITAVDFNEPKAVDALEPAPAPETMFVAGEDEEVPVGSAVVPPSEPGLAVDTTSKSITSVSAQSSIPSKAANPAVAEMPLNAQGLPNAWVIQVASLSNLDAATKLRDQLQSEGQKAFVRSVSSGNTSIHRVFIGPKLDKNEALGLKPQLDKRFKVNSMVLPFKP